MATSFKAYVAGYFDSEPNWITGGTNLKVKRIEKGVFEVDYSGAEFSVVPIVQATGNDPSDNNDMFCATVQDQQKSKCTVVLKNSNGDRKDGSVNFLAFLPSE